MNGTINLSIIKHANLLFIIWIYREEWFFFPPTDELFTIFLLLVLLLFFCGRKNFSTTITAASYLLTHIIYVRYRNFGFFIQMPSLLVWKNYEYGGDWICEDLFTVWLLVPADDWFFCGKKFWVFKDFFCWNPQILTDSDIKSNKVENFTFFWF